ncbi:PfkB family carbohydrate kinase, partial [Streptomyces sp. W16]|uniref:PfkB family carbohydrate kinase n=1 Tax=Streptomyces sp. W16 TaxID=3076631 RepID=UPI00295BE4E4
RTVAVLPLGGAPGALVADLLDAQGIEVAPVPVAGATRSNIALAEADGVLTKINAPGPELTAAEQELLLETVRRQSRDADWIACCGSLPRGLAPSWYAELVARAHAAGVRIALDTSGPALIEALRERPDVVKPNAEELAEAVSRPLATVGDAVKAAEELRELGAGAVLAFTIQQSGGALTTADLYLLAALVVCAAGYTEGGRLARVMPGWQVIAWALVLCLPLSVPAAAIALSYDTPQLTAHSVAGMLWVAAGSQFLGLVVWYRGMAVIGVPKASQLQLAQPLLTLVWSVFLLGEHLPVAAPLTAAAVLVCIAVTQRARS